MILALDLGTRTGYAMCEAGVIDVGFIDFKTKRMSGGGMRYRRFRQWLESLNPKPEAIYFEEVRRHAGTTAAHVYGGFKAILEAYCDEHNIPYEGLPVGAIKKYATGKGNANKAAMINAARRFGVDTDDDNAADAFWILKLAMEEREYARQN